MELSRAHLQVDVADPRFPPNLRELCLDSVYFSAYWASELFEASTNLTSLEMQEVNIEGQVFTDLKPACSLRYICKAIDVWALPMQAI